MCSTLEVAVFIGSLRKEAFSRKTARALIDLARSTLGRGIVEIGDLPLYNQDGQESPPAARVSLRRRVGAADAVLCLTPEYNRPVPAALKNALDITSRPYGKSAWNANPGAVVSVSPGAIGGFGANHHLRQSLLFLNVPAMQQPGAYLSSAADLFDPGGAEGQRGEARVAAGLHGCIGHVGRCAQRLEP